MKRLCSDEEFLKIWQESDSSPIRVSEVLGCSVRVVYSIRDRVEQKLGINLPTKAKNSSRNKLKGADYAPSDFETVKDKLQSRLQETRHAVRRGLAIENGQIIVFSDAHFYPDETTTAYRALLDLVKEFKPEAIVCNGDAFDGSRISKHSRIGWQHTPTVKEELDAVKHYLGEIENASAFKSNLIWTLGNHDARFETMLSNSSAHNYEGVDGFTLKDHFPLWKPCWSFWVNDDTVIKHRWKGGRYAGSNNTTFSGTSIVTGHTHQLKTEPFTDYRGTRYGVQTGTLAYPKGDQFIDYCEDNPVDWRSGFVLLTFYKGKLLMPELIQVFDENEGLYEFRGKVHRVQSSA